MKNVFRTMKTQKLPSSTFWHYNLKSTEYYFLTFASKVLHSPIPLYKTLSRLKKKKSNSNKKFLMILKLQ
jgi:hypothetical protein